MEGWTASSLLCLLAVRLFCGAAGVTECHDRALDIQAVEGSNVTVEWCFSSRANISISSLKIHCLMDPELKVFYHLDDIVRMDKEPPHEQFAGRVQCDKDALRTGRVQLHLSRVQMNDSGRYRCRMFTGSGRKVKPFSLSITAAVDEPKPLTPEPEPEPEPESRGRPGLYAGLGLAAVAAVVLALCRCLYTHKWKLLKLHQELHPEELHL
ncbi:programmed cell death 1 ligand 1-like [Pempheris klunzingeri]|uniref:programmed cell death 1 ligand 1-like n=1 Tax=Pempheris klunzingeri TaxID=3127111 RepID=UPI0039808C0E